MSTSPRRRLAALTLAAAGAAVVLSAGFAPAVQAAPAGVTARTTTTDTAWFVDPRTPAERRAAVAVPQRPRAVRGGLQETRAAYRTHAGRLAVPMRAAEGRTMVEGQAVTLDGNGLFVIRRTELTSAARTQIKGLAGSLMNASSVRCEGYADYAGTPQGARSNAAGRAAAVCDLLEDSSPGLRTSTRSYGGSWPAVVGGLADDRELNRRVVVQMTGTRPSRPTTPPVAPPVTPPVVPPVTPPVVPPTEKVPGAPVLDRVDGSVGTISYDFTAPTDDGGSPVTRYEVSTGAGWAPVVTDVAPPRTSSTRCRTARGCGSGLSGILRDLPAGVSQDLQVRAVNKVGAGAPSNTMRATAFGYPGAVSDLAASGGHGELEVSFSAPATDGGAPVLGYEISFDGGEHFTAVPGSGPTWTVQRFDLVNGTTYAVVVRAYNDWGYGETATASALVATVPDAPWLQGTVLVDGPTATLTFTSPQLDGGSDGGSPVTGYQLSTDGGLSWSAFPYTPDPTDAGVFHADLADLALGTEYAVAVRALNARGAGPRSKIRTFTPAVVPDAPTDVAATVSGTTVMLTFTAPARDGGAAVSDYEVSVDGGAWSAVSGDQTGIALAGQVAGAHTYQVRALNRVGASAAGTSNQVTVVIAPPAALPGAPTINNYGYYGAGQQVAILFTPGATNGATVTGYEMSVAGGPWLASASVLNGNQAMFDCPGMTCGWNYGSSVRLRAVTSDDARSAASASYASDPF